VSPDTHRRLPSTEQACREVLVLPTGTSITRKHVARICAVLKTALENAASVRERLAQSRPQP
jgi:dTDP-4-amino-4,6-dideoxygalactose transaminase